MRQTKKDSWRPLLRKCWYQSSSKNKPQSLTNWFIKLKFQQKDSETQILTPHFTGTRGGSSEGGPETCIFKPLPRWPWGSGFLGWHCEALHLALTLTLRTWVLRAPGRRQYHTCCRWGPPGLRGKSLTTGAALGTESTSFDSLVTAVSTTPDRLTPIPLPAFPYYPSCRTNPGPWMTSKITGRAPYSGQWMEVLPPASQEGHLGLCTPIFLICKLRTLSSPAIAVGFSKIMLVKHLARP